jgi:hypothetical protein
MIKISDIIIKPTMTQTRKKNNSISPKHSLPREFNIPEASEYSPTIIPIPHASRKKTRTKKIRETLGRIFSIRHRSTEKKRDANEEDIPLESLYYTSPIKKSLRSRIFTRYSHKK